MTEKGGATLISREKVKRLCRAHKPSPIITFHRKEVFSDGWTRWVCSSSNCGQVKFTKGMTFKEKKETGDAPHP